MGVVKLAINYRGRKYNFNVLESQPGEAIQKLRDEMHEAERLLMYACYMNCEVASRAISYCMEEFFKRKDIYRHEVKQLAKESRKALKETIDEILRHGDPEFLDNYSANFCEDIDGDLEKLRYAIEFEMQKKKIKEARLYSYVNVAFIMLQYCKRTYNTIMRELHEKYGHDFTELYVVFCPSAASSKWDIMFSKLFEKDKQTYTIDLNKSEMCKLAIEVIDHKLLDYKRIRQNIIKAYKELAEEKKIEGIDKLLADDEKAE